MTTVIEEILKSKLKAKEKVALITEHIKKDKNFFKIIMQTLRTGSDVEKGTCADILKHVTISTPELALPFIDEIIGYINYIAPRVKWGAAESIGYIVQKYPTKVEKAVPKLLINTKEESTVIRWCAAFALAEIAKNDPRSRKELLPQFKLLIAKEENNGVKNVYVKALKLIEKGKCN